jgi:hypothetical protein
MYLLRKSAAGLLLMKAESTRMKHCNFPYWQKTKRHSSFGKVMVSVFYYSRGVVYAKRESRESSELD